MANIETNEIPGNENNAKEAARLLKKAAEACKPAGLSYHGSMTVHVYQNTFAMKPTFTFCTHFAEDLPEQLAIEAAKELKVRLMKRYGHNERPKKS